MPPSSGIRLIIAALLAVSIQETNGTDLDAAQGAAPAAPLTASAADADDESFVSADKFQVPNPLISGN